MAVHHPATIVPSKAELLQAWVPHQPWTAGTDTSVLTRLGSYRFDDPDGEVGMETHLLSTADGQVLQVPLTYRGLPRESAEHSLVTTMTHTTLGDRWIYDARYDPVYATALATTILTGGREADLFEATETGLVQEISTTHVRGSGSSVIEVPDLCTAVVSSEGTTTRIQAGSTLMLLHQPTSKSTTGVHGMTLTGTWPGQEAPVVLAFLDLAR
ncbi:hypothetical protein SAMN05660748_0041 [Blastococcus aggregatus]|uniref:Maltokinase N-terminal cap domain-containing protein n=1 Tax=Blastococcus aggregatus TaxID=38502 RepID=A0A285UW02_9ACTN|nr:hypothetical protein [Blastococcus aggregatus]SOC46095.1 hypothetical protein SAMN05660748_0041 [Blastococcus aggregatus]